MKSRDISFSTAEENILFDEVLLSLAEKGEGGEVLRFWESNSLFIVLGRISKIEEDLNMDAVLKDQISVLRRCSGGGTVLQGKGCLNYSLILSKKSHPEINDINGSYRYILGKVVDALGNCGVEAHFEPISDLAIVEDKMEPQGTAGRNPTKPNTESLWRRRMKISGNAQKRSKEYILHHGTILYDFPIELITRYLKTPLKMPDYRKNRLHDSFVTNVSLDVNRFKNFLGDEFRACLRNNFVTKEELICLQDAIQKNQVREISLLTV